MALLPIFCVARFSRTDLSMLVARVLKIGKIADAVCLPLMGRCTSLGLVHNKCVLPRRD
jgi:hypothetical protein